MGRGPPATVPATPGTRGSRSATAAVPPVVPPLFHCSVGPCATARADPPPPGGTQCHHLAPGRPRGLWAYRHPPAGPGVRTLGPLQGGAAGASTAAVPTASRAGRVEQGAGVIRHAAAPVPVSPQALGSRSGWAASSGQRAPVPVAAAPGFEVSKAWAKAPRCRGLVPTPSLSFPWHAVLALGPPPRSLLSVGGRGGARGACWPLRHSHPVGGGAAEPRGLGRLSIRHPSTAVWGPSPLPGLHPSPSEDPGPSLRAGGRRGLWAYRHPSAGSGVRTLVPPQWGGRRGWYCRFCHRHWHRVRPVGSRGSGSWCRPPPPRRSPPPFWAATMGGLPRAGKGSGRGALRTLRAAAAPPRTLSGVSFGPWDPQAGSAPWRELRVVRSQHRSGSRVSGAPSWTPCQSSGTPSSSRSKTGRSRVLWASLVQRWTRMGKSDPKVS